MSQTKKQTEIYQADAPGKMFFKIRDVAKIADVKPHVLRYWESEFPNLKPQKNKNGQRIYNRKDIDLVIKIKRLLHDEKYSIAGARQYFKKHKKSPSREAGMDQISRAALTQIRAGLVDLLETIK